MTLKNLQASVDGGTVARDWIAATATLAKSGSEASFSYTSLLSIASVSTSWNDWKLRMVSYIVVLMFSRYKMNKVFSK